ncbi:M14 family metallopeptidase [Halobacillus massiliensis]|uniref:M14 family metallopeptidase n=1 Tax=Halobacillus massiliensis TaxID=1926286 RepID=UPI0009E63AF4|nr:M14 family metallocarboxypeptidase [Halobacillus massiliensis]
MIKRKISLLSLIGIMFLSSWSFGPVQAAAADTPYYGKDYSQPEQVLELFDEPDVEFNTPAFQKETQFTTQEEMLEFIDSLDKKSKNLEVQSIGKSIEGRDIPALFFSKDKKRKHFSKKPIVWLQGQIHGNEPAAGEGVLVMAEKLTGDFGDEVLNDVNIIVVPRVNPDGSYAFDRRMANDLDGNRDHIKFDNPETQALHDLFNKYQPEVTIDAHEYSVGSGVLEERGNEGYLKYHDLLILSGKNLNIPEKIRTTSDELFIDTVHDELNEEGYTSADYYTMGRDGDDIEIREGGTDPRIGRNAFGLTPSFSFLVETRGIGIGRENFKRRVAVQVETHTSLIETAADNAKSIQRLVSKEKAQIIKKGAFAHDKDQIVIEDEQKEIPDQTLTLIDIETGSLVDEPVNYYSATEAQPTLTRDRPTAYLLDRDQGEVVDKLKNSGVKVFQLPHNMKLPAEAYTVTNKEADGIYEGHQLVDVDTQLTNEWVAFEKGTYVVSMAQPNANLAAVALEPESNDSFVTFNFVDSVEGEQLPIYRFTRGLNGSTFK